MNPLSHESSYEWVTVLVIKHQAGSQEGAIFQRQQFDDAIAKVGGDVRMGGTRPGDAAAEGIAQLQRFVFHQDEGDANA